MEKDSQFKKVIFGGVSHPLFGTRHFELELPVHIEAHRARLEYEQCGGRAYFQEGHILEHDTLPLDEWMIITKGARRIIQPETS